MLLAVGGPILFVFSAAKGSGEGPKVRFLETVHDAGIVDAGGAVSHLFRLVSEGGEDLLIEDVSSTCGCIGALVGAEESSSAPTWEEANDPPRRALVAPGDSAAIRVSMDLPRALDSPEYSEEVFVRTNDPLRPVVSLRMRARIRERVWWYPPGLTLGRVKSGNVYTRTLTVRATVRLDSVWADVAGLRGIGVEATRLAANHFNVRIQVDAALAPLQEGGSELPIGIAYGDTVVSISVPFSGQIEGDVRVDPESIFLGSIAAGTRISLRLLVGEEGGVSVPDIETVHAGILGLQWNVGEVRQTGRPLFVNLVLPRSPGPLLDTLRIHTLGNPRPAVVPVAAMITDVDF